MRQKLKKGGFMSATAQQLNNEADKKITLLFHRLLKRGKRETTSTWEIYPPIIEGKKIDEALDLATHLEDLVGKDLMISKDLWRNAAHVRLNKRYFTEIFAALETQEFPEKESLIRALNKIKPRK